MGVFFLWIFLLVFWLTCSCSVPIHQAWSKDVFAFVLRLVCDGSCLCVSSSLSKWVGWLFLRIWSNRGFAGLLLLDPPDAEESGLLVLTLSVNLLRRVVSHQH